jgi:DNA-directed RNA polymerase specialized sigma24 family protein
LELAGPFFRRRRRSHAANPDRGRPGKTTRKRGGRWRRVELADGVLATDTTPDELLALDEALDQLASNDAEAAQLVKLRYFGGLSVEEAGEMLGLSRTTAYRQWRFARAWLMARMQGSGEV